MAKKPSKSEAAGVSSKQPSYVPPPRLLNGLMTRGSKAGGPATVTLPMEAFTRLLEAALTSSFNAELYLEKHADIRAGVDSGTIPSALRHYATHGFFEGRAVPEYAVDSDWYMATYPDVEQAIATGQVRDAAHHFQAFGYAEGRVPNRNYQLLIAEWQGLAKKAVVNP